MQDHSLHVLHCRLAGSGVTIKQLWLTEIGLTQLSSSFISNLTICCKVEELSIHSNNSIGEDSASYIQSAVSSILKANIFGDSIISLTSATAICLFATPQQSNSLQQLYIDYNDVNDEAHDTNYIKAEYFS